MAGSPFSFGGNDARGGDGGASLDDPGDIDGGGNVIDGLAGSGGVGGGSDGRDEFGTVDSRNLGDDFARNVDGSVKLKRDGTPARKRGRRAGASGPNPLRSGRKPTASDDKASVSAIAKSLVGIHGILATITKEELWIISDDEGKTLAVPLVDILGEFDLKPDPRLVKAYHAAQALAIVYGPRLYFMAQKRAQSKPKVEHSRDGKVAFLRPRQRPTEAKPETPPASVPGNVVQDAMDLLHLHGEE